MDQFVSVIQELGLVRITHDDEIDLTIMLTTRRAAGRRLREHNFDRLLIDVRLVPLDEQLRRAM